jgi:hypothetical protein
MQTKTPKLILAQEGEVLLQSAQYLFSGFFRSLFMITN